jgi:CheY-like chemotaxis protein
MPGIGGVAGISLVREQWKHVGVIAMTAGSKQIKPISLLNIARSAGAHKLLEKPFTEEKLIDQVP